MAYRPPTQPPLTAWAVHIDAYMRKHDLSQTQAFEAVQAALGLSPKSRTAFRPYLVDRNPDDDAARALASVFGWPDPQAKAPDPPPDPIVAAIDRQTAALKDLAAELLAWRTAQATQTVHVEQMQVIVDRLAARVLDVPGTPTPTVPPVLGEKAG